ncbi:MAG: ribosome silencing factor [Candidatus Eisenbacteria bacterium]|uniref:Ribosomal silencing factor RsfS n=1 Tax=Eiseniibacteriota bacterium TaxID=2212470 RepID=A0A956SC44_UNCEI|nr:ribosome silencing factor [Candidatus Eisenbacteria bacterium]MCB9462609.1 ribosome silencing factor [Candidatus Eisenbacteria bacterium]
MTGPETERESYELARRIADLMLEKAATDVLVLDLRTLSSACDYFVICTAASEPQVKAIAEHVEETVKKELGEGPWHIEGRSQRRWVLLDFVHVVAHVFHKEARDYYLLERLWSDAPQEEVLPKKTGVRAASGKAGTLEVSDEWEDASEEGEDE